MRHFAPASRALVALALASALSQGCRCAEPPARVFEVGAPLEDVPGAASGPLADLIPAGAPLLVLAERPGDVVRAVRADPALARLLDPGLVAGLSLSDTGATARAVRQRLNDLSRLPVPTAGLEALLDGPFALAARVGPAGTDLLLVKRLSPRAQASWQFAQMLQGVAPSLREVRVERYRGFPLRKVLVDDRRRLTYVLLRDLLVAGTSDAWVKEGLDLALGAQAPRASSREPVRLALAEEKGAALVAVVDAEALRREPGRPGPATLALTGARWLRAAVRPQGLALSLAPADPAPARSGPAALARFAPRGTLAALGRGLPLQVALAGLLSSATGDAPRDPQDPEVLELGQRLVAELGPTLGHETFWYCDGFEAGDEGERPVARHVVGVSLRTPPSGEALRLVTGLLRAPLSVEREGSVDLHCSADRSLCACQAREVLLLGNHPGALQRAVAVSEGRAPGLALPALATASDALYVDLPALGATLSAGAGKELDPLVGALRAVGPVLASVRAGAAGRLEGEVRRP